MSTKATIFLTNDHNEHLYTDCQSPCKDEEGKYIGDSMTLEISKENIKILYNDDEDIIIEFNNPNSEIYKYLLKTKGELNDEIKTTWR